MRKITMKIAAASMAAMMAVSMAGCSTNNNTQENTGVKEENTTAIVNPVKEVTEEEMVNGTGIDLPAPDGATNVVYSIIDEGELQISQMDFTLDGQDMYLRACQTSETTFDEASDDLDEITNILRKGDISGLNYEWSAEATQLVQDREANVHVTKDGVGYIAWLDPVPGILYNLCMENGATADNLVEYAEKIFVPVQGESDGDDAADINSDFNALLDEIYETKAGSAGSSSRVEAAAASFAQFVQTYSTEISLQDIEVLASDKIDSMKEECADDNFQSNFQDSLDEVVETAVNENPDFETDVAFDQLVNGIQMKLDDME